MTGEMPAAKILDGVGGLHGFTNIALALIVCVSGVRCIRRQHLYIAMCKDYPCVSLLRKAALGNFDLMMVMQMIAIAIDVLIDRYLLDIVRGWTAIKTTSRRKMNYAAAAGGSNRTVPSRGPANINPQQNPPSSTNAAPSSDSKTQPTASASPKPKRAPSPSHVPRTARDEEAVYVLTLLTDAAHHARMTAFRKQYFPAHLNKLDAHLTLFHALPGSQLAESIEPGLARVARETATFEVHATRPFRLKKGIAIAVPKTRGGAQAADVHARLLERWERQGWLSDQDAQRGGGQVHYTLMNKVDDEEVVARRFEEVKGFWKTDVGVARGLGLWRYERGWWKWERGFEFQGKGGVEKKRGEE
nr:hypothetical protein CFP56_37148 [Quercus suber]